jgi:integrase
MDSENGTSKRRGGRAPTGQLILRRSGWYARITATIEGERLRVMRPLGTQNKAVAKRKLARLLASENPKTEDITRGETFTEAADRVYEALIADVEGDRSRRDELAQLRRYAAPVIGTMAATKVATSDVNAVLDHGKTEGLSRQSVQHLKQRLSNVFAQLKREGAIAFNPVADAEIPKFRDEVIKERAVLTDLELAIYLAWLPTEERFQGAARERQTMSCVSRMFGGQRTSDLHSLRWEGFDVEGGAFTWGYAPRAKTRRPQLLEVPAMLRPILRDWWQRAGRPSEGLVFPVTRVGKLGDRVGQERRHVSHAAAFRRDVQAAFKAARERGDEGAPAETSARWRELFTEPEDGFTLPVDFHSWRRGFAQAPADADVNAQQAAALAGHASLAAHARYLRSAGKLRKMPEAALPDIVITHAPMMADIEAEQSAHVQRQRARVSAENDQRAQVTDAANPRESSWFDAQGLPVTPEVAGSSPVRPAEFH